MFVILNVLPVSIKCLIVNSTENDQEFKDKDLKTYTVQVPMEN